MDYEYNGKVLKFDKTLSDLDKLVIDFVGLLNGAKIKYVIISGYVSILLGRSRTTEDIDVFIDKIGYDDFQRFFNLSSDSGYWSVDSDSLDDAFDRLQNSLSIRLAKKGTVVPNFEVKFPKKKLDLISLNSPLEVIVNNSHLLMSPLEIQIPFKIWLGSEKDIEDAVHIYELFKGKLDRNMMSTLSKELKVEAEMIKYGIV